jgi:hypothetical protein
MRNRWPLSSTTEQMRRLRVRKMAALVSINDQAPGAAGGKPGQRSPVGTAPHDQDPDIYEADLAAIIDGDRL